MSLTKRIISAFLVMVMFFSVLYAGNQVKEQEKQEVFDNTRTLHIWYTDEALTDYLSSMAVKYNEENGIIPQTIVKGVRDIIEISGDNPTSKLESGVKMTRKERDAAIAKLEKQMKEAARMLEFEVAAALRDRIIKLRGESD